MKHGGLRAGAGRKMIDPADRKVTISARVSPAIAEWLRGQMEKKGKSLGQIIEEMYEACNTK